MIQNSATKRGAAKPVNRESFAKLGTFLTGVVIATCLTACGSEAARDGAGNEKAATETIAARVDMLNSATKCDDVEKLISKTKSKDLSEFQRFKLDASQNVCSLKPGLKITTEISEKLEADGVWAKIENDELRVYGRSATEDEAPQLCCSIKDAVWTQLSDYEWGARFRLADAAEARLMFKDLSGTSKSPAGFHIYGDDAKQTEIPFLKTRKDKLTGKLSVRQKFSPELEETRLFSMYLPSKDFGTEAPILIFADGKSLDHYSRMVDPMISSGQISPVIMVGLYAGNKWIRDPKNPVPDDARAADYVKGADPEHSDRYAEHMDFVFNTLLPELKTEFEKDYEIKGMAVVGQSDGAVFATRAGLEYPDDIDSVLAVSQSFSGITDTLEDPERSPRFYLSAGLYEPALLAATKVTRDTLKSQGYDVSAEYEAVGHDPDFYKLKLFEFLRFEYGTDFP